MPTIRHNVFGPKLSTHSEGAYRSQWSSGKTLDCGVLGPRIKAHCSLVFNTTITALGTGCAPLL